MSLILDHVQVDITVRDAEAVNVDHVAGGATWAVNIKYSSVGSCAENLGNEFFLWWISTVVASMVCCHIPSPNEGGCVKDFGMSEVFVWVLRANSFCCREEVHEALLIQHVDVTDTSATRSYPAVVR